LLRYGIAEDEQAVNLSFVQELIENEDSKIFLLVLDGLGGLPLESDGLTALEAASTPSLDMLAKRGICGLHQPVGPGITPGSGPSHLALFGYDPQEYQVGRGVLAALGIGFDLTPQDVAARGNFCTVDESGIVVDRRAGRIPTEKNRELCDLLRQINLPGVDVYVETVKEYRLLLVLRGEGLGYEVGDTDPQETGVRPLEPEASSAKAKETARLLRIFLERAREVLVDQHPANMVLFRGFSRRPHWPSFEEVFGLRAAAIASYPMYRGVARLVGMEVLETGPALEDRIGTLRARWEDYDFFFLHVKRTDSAGEDGAFERKVALIEEVDRALPEILSPGPDVVLVTGDHSTPAKLQAHSWHPVPVVLWSKHCRPDAVDWFGERACVGGGLGPRIPAIDLMPLAMANALRLKKFGA
jgi:2,3-bisphosphoglycerate-independent phosphoglycerate mutase